MKNYQAMVRWACFFLLFTISFSVSAQKMSADDSRFQNAREMMDLGKFGLAMQALRPLTSNYEGNIYTKIASYYYAVSAYNDGQKYVAKDMFLQILQQYPDWDKTDKVNLWLANIYFAENDLKSAFNYVSFIDDNEIKASALELKNGYLSGLSLDELDSLLQAYPSDKTIAANLAAKIAAQPIGEQDREYLENIVSVF